MILYHYTCEHAAAKIVAAGMLHGSAHRMLAPAVDPLIWLTTDPTGERNANGLPYHDGITSRCDRAEIRVTVDTEQALPWARWARKNKIDIKRIQAVETLVRGSLVGMWFVIIGDHPYKAIERGPVWSPYTPTAESA